MSWLPMARNLRPSLKTISVCTCTHTRIGNITLRPPDRSTRLIKDKPFATFPAPSGFLSEVRSAKHFSILEHFWLDFRVSCCYDVMAKYTEGKMDNWRFYPPIYIATQILQSFKPHPSANAMCLRDLNLRCPQAGTSRK